MMLTAEEIRDDFPDGWEQGKPGARPLESAEERIEPGPPVGDAELEPIGRYLNEIGRVPLLTPEQEVAVARRIEAGQQQLLVALAAIPYASRALLDRTDRATRRERLQADRPRESVPTESDLHRLLGQPIKPEVIEALAADLQAIAEELARVQAQTAGPRRTARLRVLEARIGLSRPRFRRALAEVVRWDDAVRRAKQDLMEANLRLVVSIAKRYVGRGLPLLDLIQEGNLGLMKAVDRFQYRRGFKFSTYATWWIRQGVQRAITDLARTIRLPAHVSGSLTRIDAARAVLSRELGREPTLPELAARVELPLEKVRLRLEARIPTASLDAPSDDGPPIGGVLQIDAASPEDQAVGRDLRRRLAQQLAPLTRREREIISLRFGMGTDREHTHAEIGRRYGLSRERIRQIELQVLQKLRRAQQRPAGALRSAS
jgi:RNA polymerase sigma factor (sigma-70 family)